MMNIDIWKRQIMSYLNSNANNIKRLLQRKIREIIRKFFVSLFKLYCDENWHSLSRAIESLLE